MGQIIALYFPSFDSNKDEKSAADHSPYFIPHVTPLVKVSNLIKSHKT